MPHLRILGIRGLPAAHGGFETFAEYLAIHLRDAGWKVTVYCQIDGSGPTYIDDWEGIERINIPVDVPGPKGTMLFDWRAIAHASRTKELCLTLGYNTAAFCAWLRLKAVPNVINMDGIEWSRAKWSGAAKAWFWLNDWAGCWLGNHLVADHPEIAEHLSTRVSKAKITTIAYGAERLHGVSHDAVVELGLEPKRYLTLIARPEPENSVLEVVQAFSNRVRAFNLVVLGKYDQQNAYHRAVKAAAGGQVIFPGAIYDKSIVQALRFHSLAYIHGHQVGGTNPSLVEALGAGNPVIAHDNRFNRWVAGDGARYFASVPELSQILTDIELNPDLLRQMAAHSVTRFEAGLTWPQILGSYKELLSRYI